jgi:hypothetical protein
MKPTICHPKHQTLAMKAITAKLTTIKTQLNAISKPPTVPPITTRTTASKRLNRNLLTKRPHLR